MLLDDDGASGGGYVVEQGRRGWEGVPVMLNGNRKGEVVLLLLSLGSLECQSRVFF